jgi:hypothetical protein
MVRRSRVTFKHMKGNKLVVGKVKISPSSVRRDFCAAYRHQSALQLPQVELDCNQPKHDFKVSDGLFTFGFKLEKQKKWYLVQCIIDGLNMASKLSS